MKHLIDPGRTRPSIFHFDHIVYSHVEDLNGDPLALELSLLSPMEGKELQIALGRKKPEENPDARTDGAVIGGNVDTVPVRAEEFTAQLGVHDKMPPFLIMHGDADPAVPYQESVAFYDKISSYPGNDVDLYLVHGAGHGTPEFFQPAVQKIALDFFEKKLRG